MGTFIEFLYQIQIALLVGSGLLAAGCFIGIYKKTLDTAAELIWLLPSSRRPSLVTIDDLKEKRRARRVPSHAVLELQDESGGFAGAARLHDLSIKGARFDIPLAMGEGKKIHALLHSSEEGILEITGRIVWAKPQARSILYGVKFQTVHPNHP